MFPGSVKLISTLGCLLSSSGQTEIDHALFFLTGCEAAVSSGAQQARGAPHRVAFRHDGSGGASGRVRLPSHRARDPADDCRQGRGLRSSPEARAHGGRAKRPQPGTGERERAIDPASEASGLVRLAAGVVPARLPPRAQAPLIQVWRGRSMRFQAEMPPSGAPMSALGKASSVGASPRRRRTPAVRRPWSTRPWWLRQPDLRVPAPHPRDRQGPSQPDRNRHDTAPRWV